MEGDGGITLGQGLDLFIKRRAKSHIKSWKQYQSYFDRVPKKIKNMSVENMGKTILRDYLQDASKISESSAIIPINI